jgi:hypothetical protein
MIIRCDGHNIYHNLLYNYIANFNHFSFQMLKIWWILFLSPRVPSNWYDILLLCKIHSCIIISSAGYIITNNVQNWNRSIWWLNNNVGTHFGLTPYLIKVWTTSHLHQSWVDVENCYILLCIPLLMYTFLYVSGGYISYLVTYLEYYLW